MRNLIYDLIWELGTKEVAVIAFTGKAIVQVIGAIANGSISIIAYVNNIILLVVNRERYRHALALSTQYGAIRELDVIRRAIMVKDNAIEVGNWTPAHTSAISKLSTELYNFCDWKEEQIHAYMKPLVESVPGVAYVYGSNDSDDDDDDDDTDFETIGAW